ELARQETAPLPKPRFLPSQRVMYSDDSPGVFRVWDPVSGDDHVLCRIRWLGELAFMDDDRACALHADEQHRQTLAIVDFRDCNVMPIGPLDPGDPAVDSIDSELGVRSAGKVVAYALRRSKQGVVRDIRTGKAIARL